MKRRALIAAGAAAAVAGLGVAWWRQPRLSGQDAEFWGLRLPRPEGGELSLSVWLGQPLIVNFWATWCAPCVRELPRLDAFWRQHRGAGWQVLGWAIDDDRAVRSFLQRLPLGFAVTVAPVTGLDWSRRLGNGTGGLPFSVLIGRDGRPLRTHAGELLDTDLEAWRSLVEG